MSLTEKQIAELKEKNEQFRRLTEQFGEPKSVSSPGDPTANPGDICMEGACIEGKMLVMFVDEHLNCSCSDTVSC